MSELCISCNSSVSGRRHAVTCDVCGRKQHRLCGTGILFILLFSFTVLLKSVSALYFLEVSVFIIHLFIQVFRR